MPLFWLPHPMDANDESRVTPNLINKQVPAPCAVIDVSIVVISELISVGAASVFCVGQHTEVSKIVGGQIQIVKRLW